MAYDFGEKTGFDGDLSFWCLTETMTSQNIDAFGKPDLC